jgi:amidase
MSAQPLLNLLITTATELLDGLTSDKFSSVDLVTKCLAQIERHNHEGLQLNAVISTPPKNYLLKTAQKLDNERSKGELRSPLHGVPVLVKDAIMTDHSLGMPTTAGAQCLRMPDLGSLLALC